MDLSNKKVKVNSDGNIDFTMGEVPTSLKKFRQSPEIEGFYRFIYENELRVEALDIIEGLLIARKDKTKKAKNATKS
jgi:hypothetical protein